MQQHQDEKVRSNEGSKVGIEIRGDRGAKRRIGIVEEEERKRVR